MLGDNGHETVQVVRTPHTPNTPEQKTFWHRLFLFFEHPLFWGPIGIIGGLVGLFFYTPILILSGVCILLAFHRAGVVFGKRPRVQIIAFLVVAVLAGGSLYGLRLIIQKHAPDIGQEIAERVVDALKKDRPAIQPTKAPHIEPSIRPTYVSAQCFLPKDFSPCEISCSVYNPHETAMSDISVGFNGLYSYETRLASGTETHMFIKKQNTLPLPMAGGYVDQNLQAFSVEIPLIPAKVSLMFTLWSRFDDNQKTCSYLKTVIRAEQRKKIDQLAAMKRDLNANMMESLQTKKASLFVPGYFMSAEGRRKVEFVTNQEERNAKGFSDLYDKVGKTIPAKRCLIPIFAAERNDGSPYYFANAPPMMTWVFNRESMKMTTRPDGTGTIETDPHPPANYSCEDN